MQGGQHEAEESAARMTDGHVEHSESQPLLQLAQGRCLRAGGVVDSCIGDVGGLFHFWRFEFKFVAAQLPNLTLFLFSEREI